MTRLKIISLNLYQGLLSWLILDYIKSHRDSTAIFCLQEAEPPILAAISPLLQDSHYLRYEEKPAFRPGVLYRQATFIRKDIDLESSETILTDNPSTGLATNYHLKTTDGMHLALTNFHGVSRPGDKLDNEARLEQSRKIILSHVKHNLPTVVLGDFNLLPSTRSIAKFEDSGYINLIKHFDIPTTRNRLAWDRHPEDRQLHADYVFMRGIDIGDISFEVELNEISDHLPLILTLNLPLTPMANYQDKQARLLTTT